MEDVRGALLPRRRVVVPLQRAGLQRGASCSAVLCAEEGRGADLGYVGAAQISDFEYLAKAFKAVCKEAEETILLAKE